MHIPQLFHALIVGKQKSADLSVTNEHTGRVRRNPPVNGRGWAAMMWNQEDFSDVQLCFWVSSIETARVTNPGQFTVAHP